MADFKGILMSKKTIFIILAAIILPAVNSLAVDELLHSDFESDHSAWTQEYGGQWQIANGVYQGIDRSSWAGEKTWTDYRFSCKARSVEVGGNGEIWLSVRYNDEWNRYAIAVRGGLLNDVSLFRYRASDPPRPSVMCPLNVPLGFDFKPNQWYEIKVEVVGSRIRIWVGDCENPQIDYIDDDPIASGAVALGGNYQLCEFDDVSVERLDKIIDATPALSHETKETKRASQRKNYKPADVGKLRGDEAYEHRDPKHFLDFNAFITKEWIEDVRRTRKTAGWMAFCNSCWFKYVSFADHIEPYPVYFEAGKALSPVLVSLDQRDRHCYAGSDFRGNIVVVNDDTEGRNLANLACTINLKDSAGKILHTKTIKLNDCDYYSKTKKGFTFKIPEDVTESRADFKLELIVKAQGLEIAKNNYSLLIASRRWAISLEKTEPKAKTTVLMSGPAISKHLSELGIDTADRSNTFESDVIIWANERVPLHSTFQAKRLLKFVDNGGTLVLLETENVEDLLPGVIKSRFKSDMPQAWQSNVEFANIEQPSHEIFDGFESCDVRWWNGNGSSLYAAKSTYIMAGADNVTELCQHVPIHGYGWKGPVTCPMFIVKHGQGKILVSELKFSACRTDPLPAKMLTNIIKWLN